MKRVIVSAVLFLCLGASLSAQKSVEPCWTVRGSASYLPSVPTVLLPFVAIGIGLSTDSETENSDGLLLPVFSVETLYSPGPRWSFGVDVSYSRTFFRAVNKTTGEVRNQFDLSLIPVMAEARFNYLSSPRVHLYGSAEAGVLLLPGNDDPVIFSAQLNPIGVEFGGRFFGLAELGVGFSYTGLRAGIGYRF